MPNGDRAVGRTRVYKHTQNMQRSRLQRPGLVTAGGFDNEYNLMTISLLGVLTAGRTSISEQRALAPLHTI